MSVLSKVPNAYCGLSRRTVITALAATGSSVLIGRHASAQQAFNWKRFAGAKISVLFQKSPRADLFQINLKEFEALTGISVSFESMPEQQQRQKVVIEYASGSPSFDVANISLSVQKRLASKGQWFADLRPLMANPDLTPPDFAPRDLAKAALTLATQADGSIDTLPNFLDYWILYYNKELVERVGLGVPKTIAEMIAICERVHKPAADLYGFLSRGLKNANVPVWTTFLSGFGQSTVAANGKLLTDTNEAVEAAELYARLNTEFGPAGQAGFNWGECQTTFAQGRAAFWIDGIGFAAPLENPQRSKVAGKVGYAVIPKGALEQGTVLFADGIGVSRASRNKEAAYLFLMWALGTANQGRMLRAGAGVPSRLSSLADPANRPAGSFANDYFDTLSASSSIARPGVPEIIPVTEFRDTFGIALARLLEGGKAREELGRATEAFAPVLEVSEKS